MVTAATGVAAGRGDFFRASGRVLRAGLVVDEGLRVILEVVVRETFVVFTDDLDAGLVVAFATTVVFVTGRGFSLVAVAFVAVVLLDGPFAEVAFVATVTLGLVAFPFTGVSLLAGLVFGTVFEAGCFEKARGFSGDFCPLRLDEAADCPIFPRATFRSRAMMEHPGTGYDWNEIHGLNQPTAGISIVCRVPTVNRRSARECEKVRRNRGQTLEYGIFEAERCANL